MNSLVGFVSPVSVKRFQTSVERKSACSVLTYRVVRASLSNASFGRHSGREPTCGKTFCADLLGFGAARTGAEDFTTMATKAIFGNAHLYEEDLADLASVYSRFAENGDVRELVGGIGKSESFRSHFLEPNSSVRFVEICFKVFLGRGPMSQSEVSEKIQMLASSESSYDEFIDSYVDSKEYENKFGPALLPTFEKPGGLYGNGMTGFMSNMKVNVTTRGGNTDATPITSLSQAVVAGGDSASSLFVAAGHSNLLPQYEGFSVSKIDSVLTTNYADILIPSKAASNWSGLAGTMRESVPVDEDWSAGWTPDAKETWSPGWAPQTKRYV